MDKFLLQWVSLSLRFYSWQPLSLNCDLHFPVAAGVQTLTRPLVLWTLRDRCRLCGRCCVPRACHHSVGLFLNIYFSVKMHRLPLSHIESVDVSKSKAINQSINRSFFFSSCCTDSQVILSSHVQTERNQVGLMFPLSWVLHWAICFDFSETERQQPKTL